MRNHVCGSAMDIDGAGTSLSIVSFTDPLAEEFRVVRKDPKRALTFKKK